MTHSYTSWGEQIQRSVIDRNIREAKQRKLDEFLEEHDYYFCEDCKENKPEKIDCSHNLSVADCHKNSCIELAWDVENIKLRHRSCHRKKDRSGLHFSNN